MKIDKMKLSCIVLSFAVISCHISQSTAVQTNIRIPLKKIPTTLQKLNKIMEEIQTLESNETDFFAKNWNDFEYYGEISIGEKKQKIDILVDTNSQGIKIISKYCNVENFAEFFKNFRNPPYDRYNNRISSNQTILENNNCQNFTFGSRWMCGISSSETFTMDDFKSIQPFYEIMSINGMDLSNPFNGILGLRYNPKNESDNILAKLCNSNENAKFSLYLTTDSSNPSSNGNELMLCLMNETKSKYSGELNFVDETQPGSWAIIINEFVVMTHSFKSTATHKTKISLTSFHETIKSSALISTGTSLIIGPQNYITSVYDEINYSEIPNYGSLRKVNCQIIDELPTLKFNINGEEYDFEGRDYIIPVENECVVGIAPSNQTTWILGGIFLKKFYTVFDQNNHRIGFAKSIPVIEESTLVTENQSDSNIEVILIIGALCLCVVGIGEGIRRIAKKFFKIASQEDNEMQ